MNQGTANRVGRCTTSSVTSRRSGISDTEGLGLLRIFAWRKTVLVITLAIAFAIALMSLLRPPTRARSVAVGVDQSPPFYLIDDKGGVSGLAVDVLNEAARRRGILIHWVPLHDVPLDEALQRRIVQLWPLVGTTPERERTLYLSKPWLQSDYVLVSLKERAIYTADQAAGLTVAHGRLRSAMRLADRFLWRSKRLVEPLREHAVRDVCTGLAQAALVESRVLDAILLTRPFGCADAQFHISTLPGATASLSIGAVPEARQIAIDLRNEITRLSENGYMSAKLDEWSPFSAEGTRSIWTGEAAEKRNRVYRYVLLTIALLAAVLAWVAQRAWNLKRIAEQSQIALRDTQRRFTAFMDNSPAMSFMKDSEGRMLYVNRAWASLFGRSPEQCYGKTDFSLWPADVAHNLRAADLELLAGNEPRQWIEQVPVASGDTRDFLTVKFPFANESGEKFVGGTGIDITQREMAVRQLAESEARYRELFEHNPLPAWVYDLETLEFLTVNEAACKRYAWTREEFIHGLRLTDVDFGPVGHITKEGLLLTVDITGYQLNYEGREARLMIIRDVTEERRMLEQLRMSEERWQLALSGAGDALWDWDLATRSVFRSPRWAHMLGYEENEIGDSRDDLLRLLHPDDAPAVEAALNEHLARQTPAFSMEYRLKHKDGSWRWIMDRGQAVWDERGNAVRMAGSQTDVTERRTAADLLASEARTDSLTGLLNRREFDRRFAVQVRAAVATGKPLTVCICDLDHFKAVNDTHGHAVGDQVLARFAAILRNNVRKTDLIARVGGDEFLVSLPNTSSSDACALVERTREQLQSCEFEAHGNRFHLSCSFGVAELKNTAGTGADLISAADRLLYGAKDTGRNRTMAA